MKIRTNRKLRLFIIILLFSSNLVMFLISEANSLDYSEDYTYNVEVGDVFIFRSSENSEPIFYEKFTIISKIEGFLDNCSIHASYENYTLDSQIKESESNITLDGLHIRYYEDIKPGGIFENDQSWYSDTIEIMGSNVECWATSNPEGTSPWYDKSTGVLQKRIHNSSSGSWEYILVNDEDVDLAVFAEQDASSQGSDEMITYEGTLHLSNNIYDQTQFLDLKDDGIMSGSGSNEDPYLIENVKFSSTSTEDDNAIYVSSYFNKGDLVIKNCVIESGYKSDSICIKQSQVVDIINLTVNGGEVGICISESKYCSVKDCEILFSEIAGIQLSYGPSDLYSSCIEIHNNFIHNITNTGEYNWMGSGIVLQSARECEIIGNNVKDCVGYGYHIENLDSCYDNLIKDNDFSGNDKGCIGKVSGKDNNDYENNTCDDGISGYSPLVLITIAGITITMFLQKGKKNWRKFNFLTSNHYD